METSAIKLVLVFAAGLLGLTCIENKAPAIVEPIEVENVCRTESDGKIVAVKGYLTLPKEVFCRRGECSLELRSKLYGGERIGIKVQVGNDPGQIDQLHSDYSNADLKLHTTTMIAGNGDLVELTGKIWFSEFLDRQCWIEVSSARKDIPANHAANK